MRWALNVAGFLAILVVAATANDGSVSLQHHQASFLPLLAAHGKGKEPAWPRHLSDANERSPQGYICFDWLIELEEAKGFKAWTDCIRQKASTTNMSVAGSSFAIRQECWCETRMEALLSWYGCESHPGYAIYFQVSCTPTCSAPAAQQCILDCPASCLELDYAPEFCSTALNGCVENLLCITEHSKNMTLAGHEDHPLLCDDASWGASPQWLAWKECYSKLPKRTHWHRHNAENHCNCEVNLKAPTVQHKCCDSKWGKGICDEQCVTNTDCTSAEATQCAATCNKICLSLLQTISPECKVQCFESMGMCSKYSVCPPAGDIAFDYVCDDESKPKANGCCGSRCPSQCTNAKGYLFTHGQECQCLGCPSSKQEARTKLTAQMANDMDAHGIQALAAISKKVGILGANRKMQELMNERNAEIQKAFKDHPGGVDAAWNQKAAFLIKQYRALIVAEALNFKARGEVDKPLDGKGDGDSNSGVIIAVVCGAVGLCLCASSLLLYNRGKARNQGAGNTGMGNVGPNDGDSNVVMGRPVENGATSNAAQGAPVIRDSEKESTEPEKPTTAP